MMRESHNDTRRLIRRNSSTVQTIRNTTVSLLTVLMVLKLIIYLNILCQLRAFVN